MKIKPVKVTFQLLGRSNNKLNTIQQKLKTKHDKHISRTDLLNIAVSEFLDNIKTPEDTLEYLIKYNKI